VREQKIIKLQKGMKLFKAMLGGMELYEITRTSLPITIRGIILQQKSDPRPLHPKL